MELIKIKNTKNSKESPSSGVHLWHSCIVTAMARVQFLARELPHTAGVAKNKKEKKKKESPMQLL